MPGEGVCAPVFLEGNSMTDERSAKGEGRETESEASAAALEPPTEDEKSAEPFSQPEGAPEEQPYGAAFGEEAVPQGSKAKAIVALVLGILSLPLCVVPPAGLILGIAAVAVAASCLKAGAQENKASIGRICGVVGIVFSAILLVAALVVVGLYGDRVKVLLGLDVEEAPVEVVKRQPTDENPPMEEVYSQSELAAYNAVIQRLDALKQGNPAVVAPIAAIASSEFQDALGFSMEECGIDPAQYVQLMAQDATYEIDLIVTNDNTDTGLVTATIKMRSVFAVLDNYNERIQTLDRTSATLGMTDAQVRARLGEEFLAAVDETTETVVDNASFSMTFLNGTWVIDQDSWDREMEYLFGVYDSPAEAVASAAAN